MTATINPKLIITNAFKEIFETSPCSENTITKFFDPKYQQFVNGKNLNYQEFVNHIAALQNKVTNIKVEFLVLIAEGSQIASHHMATAYKKDDKTLIKGEVFAIFTLQNNKIINCSEITRMLDGNKANQELASIH